MHVFSKKRSVVHLYNVNLFFPIYQANSSFLVPFFIGIAVGIGVLILAIFIAIILR